MSLERIEELASMVSLGAATAEEHAEFERWLQSAEHGALAQSAVDSFAATAAAFAESLTPMTPPMGGLTTLVQSLGGQAGGQRAPIPEYAEAPLAFPPERVGANSGGQVISLAAVRAKRLLASGLIGAMAAAAVFLFLFLRERDRVAEVVASKDQAVEAIRVEGQGEIDKLAADLEKAGARVAALDNRLAPLRGANVQLATLRAKEGAYAHVLSQGDGERWVIYAPGLPTASATSDYQMWFVPESGAPVSAGLLRPDADGMMAATIELPKALRGTRLRPAISLEPKGGSAAPTEVKLIGDPI